MIEIKEKHNCCGCEACSQTCPKHCIRMREDEEGFCYPEVIKVNCVECQLCEMVCPMRANVTQQVQEVELKSYIAFSEDESIRLASSSGGLFSVCAKKILRENGVVFGAAFDEDFMVHHIVIDCEEQLKLLQGSKYLQSRIENTYNDAENYLKEGKKVLFSGTPCQIAGLKRFLRKDWANLITIDILCHGVPSPKVWYRYLKEQEEMYGGTVQQTFFRHKNYGWKKYALLLKFSNNKAYENILSKDRFMQFFLSNICLRPACYFCQFKEIPHPSDITLGDCWGVEQHSPEMDDDKGTSVVIVNSPIGKELFESISDGLITKEMPLDIVLPVDAESRNSVEAHCNRNKFFAQLNGGERTSILLKLIKPGFFRKVMNKLLHIKTKVMN